MSHGSISCHEASPYWHVFVGATIAPMLRSSVVVPFALIMAATSSGTIPASLFCQRYVATPCVYQQVSIGPVRFSHESGSCRALKPVATQKSSSFAFPAGRVVPPPFADSVSTTSVTSFRVSRLGAEFRRTPSDSNNTFEGSKFPEPATTNTRRRRWATPKYWASRTRHAIEREGQNTAPAFVHFPPVGRSGTFSPASLPRRHPKALVRSDSRPGTFS